MSILVGDSGLRHGWKCQGGRRRQLVLPSCVLPLRTGQPRFTCADAFVAIQSQFQPNVRQGRRFHADQDYLGLVRRSCKNCLQPCRPRTHEPSQNSVAAENYTGATLLCALPQDVGRPSVMINNGMTMPYELRSKSNSASSRDVVLVRMRRFVTDNGCRSATS